MNVFISGGCKNGKSYYAQRRAKEQADEFKKPLYYIATMIPHDDEDRARIKRHICEREGWGFTTIEQGKNLIDILSNDKIDRAGVFLMDSVTALLNNEMFDEAGNVDYQAPARIRQEVLEFAAGTGNTVFVSDYIYGDAASYSKTTEDYRRGLASIDRALAKECEQVVEVSYGMQERWK